MFGLPALPKLPANESIYAVPKGLALGFSKFFGKISPLSSNSAAASAVIIMVVQPNERNAFDQRAIEYELLRTYKIQLLRMTLAEINRLASIDASSGNLIV